MDTFERVILVHGTGASAASASGQAWWQDQGPLWRRLSEKSGGKLRPEAFIWSGANSESARRDAGVKLYERLRDIEAEGHDVHLVGHSHGGSVIWHALNEFNAVPGQFEKVVRSWSSVGTPFLAYGLRVPRVCFRFLALVFSAVYLSLLAISTRDVEFTYAFRDEPFSTAAWLLLAAAPMAILLVSAVSLLPAAKYLWRRKRSSGALVSRDGATRYLSLWSTQDEPIVGLGASGSFSIKVFEEAPAAPVRRAGSLLHPIASGVNQFVNNAISRAVQGSSIDHLELRSTSNFPHPSLAQRPLPSRLDEQLIEQANEHSASLGKRVRELLLSGRDPVSGFSDLQIAAGRAMTFKELVHTTYFALDGCVELLLLHIQVNSRAEIDFVPTAEAASAYADRFLEHGEGEKVLPVVLPSNRMGFLVGLAAAALLTVLGLIGFAHGALYQVALAPTTAGHQLREIVTGPLLSEALGSAQFGVAESEQERILQSYLSAVIHANKLPLLLDASQKLESEYLTARFQIIALPLANEELRRLGQPEIALAMESVSARAATKRGCTESEPESGTCAVRMNESVADLLDRRKRSAQDEEPRPAVQYKIDRADRKTLQSFLSNFPVDSFVIEKTIRQPMTEVMFDTLERHLCSGLSTGSPPPPIAKDDLSRLKPVMRAVLGKPQERVPERVARWIEKVMKDQAFCDPSAGSSDLKADAAAMAAIHTLTLVVADWLFEKYPKEAYKLATKVRLRISPYRGEYDHTESRASGEFADWFQRHGYLIDALKVSRELPRGARLVRRIAFFKLAACLNWQGHSSWGPLFAKFGYESESLARSYGKQAEALEVLVAEALFHASASDWRSAAVTVCLQCDQATRLAVAMKTIPALATSPLPPEVAGQCPTLNMDEVSRLVVDEDEALERDQPWIEIERK